MKTHANILLITFYKQITCREEDQGWIYGVYTCEAENGVGKGDIDLNVLRARKCGHPDFDLVIKLLVYLTVCQSSLSS